MHTYLHFSMFDWSGKNGNKSGKSQGILKSRVSGNPDSITYTLHRSLLHCLWFLRGVVGT